jgi:DNA-directed RNA polymerase delta subunit
MKKNLINFVSPIKKAILKLKEKEQDILISYFGIDGQTHTLESIGKRYKITRERVRQIKNNALRKIDSLADKNYRDIHLNVEKFIKNSGGIVCEEHLTEKFLDSSKGSNFNAFIFSLFSNKNLGLAKETDCHKKLWIYNGKTAQLIAPACKQMEKILAVNKKPFNLSNLINQFKKTSFYKKNAQSLSLNLLKTIPYASKSMMKTEKGEWALKSWREVNPRNTRDKIHYILLEAQKPLHFRELTKRIATKNFRGKNPASATVHNELIADKRFVLIGKGIYALASWGYKPGTVADVLKEILTSVKKGLTQENLISEVLKVRQISKNTVIMNLRSQKIFARDQKSNLWKLAK